MKSSLKEINGRYYMPAKVSMLPTDRKATIVQESFLGNKRLILGRTLNIGDIGYHLYFTSNEEIKEGDLVLMPNNELHRMSPTDMIHYLDSQSKSTKKIIATTDKSIGLPEPSKEFLKVYVKAYNEGKKIEEVLVEYKDYCDYDDDNPSGYVDVSDWRLVVDTYNTITIKKVKDSWSYEEHCVDMQYYMEHCERSGYVTPQEWLSKYKHY